MPETRTVTRNVLEGDERAYVARLGASDWTELLLLARAAKAAGLHLEIDPSPTNAVFIEAHFARRKPTLQKQAP